MVEARRTRDNVQLLPCKNVAIRPFLWLLRFLPADVYARLILKGLVPSVLTSNIRSCQMNTFLGANLVGRMGNSLIPFPARNGTEIAGFEIDETHKTTFGAFLICGPVFHLVQFHRGDGANAGDRQHD